MTNMIKVIKATQVVGLGALGARVVLSLKV
jgi:hypothetical protein